jgi:glycerol-3-phosphate dehydrogenase (NAD(P)+)
VKRVTVLGGGSWGTTLALVLHDNGHQVAIWEFDSEQVKAVRNDGENRKFLPGVPLPASIEITDDLSVSLDGAEAVVFAVPSHVVRGVAGTAAGMIPNGIHVVNVAKGIENKTAVFTRDLFMTEYLRVYTNTDLIGVELGVSLKNVIAIAAGICDGLGYGDNTKGALLTRGLAEMTRLGVTMGGRPETFAGLSGMGDLITTCISKHSRNRHVGEAIADGRSLDEILDSMVMVAEGVRTTRSVAELSEKLSVEMPICEQMNLVLFEGKPPREAIANLMLRDPRPEHPGT